MNCNNSCSMPCLVRLEPLQSIIAGGGCLKVHPMWTLAVAGALQQRVSIWAGVLAGSTPGGSCEFPEVCRMVEEVHALLSCQQRGGSKHC